MKRKELLFTAIFFMFYLVGFHQSLNAQGFQLEINSSQYERFVQEAKESEGVSTQQLARFYSQNLLLQSSEEETGVRLIVLLLDNRGSVISKRSVQPEGLRQRTVRLGRVMHSSQISGLLEESIPGARWVPGDEWISDSANFGTMDDLERVAEQMAIKIDFMPASEEFNESFAMAFAITPSGTEWQSTNPFLAVFPLYMN